MARWSLHRTLQLLKFNSVILLLVYGLTLHAQNAKSILVLNKQTNNPVSYYYLECDDDNYYIGNDQGQAIINSIGKCTISCIGFESKDVILTDTNDTIYLTPVTYELDSIKISSDNRMKTMTLGPAHSFQLFKRYFQTHFESGSILLFLENGEKYPSKIESLILPVNILNPNLYLRIRIVNVDEDGTPGKDLLEPFIWPYNRNTQKIDVSRFKITFPSEGIYIGIDWFMDPSSYSLDSDSSKKEFSLIAGDTTSYINIPTCTRCKNIPVYLNIARGDRMYYPLDTGTPDYDLIPKWGIQIKR